MNSVKIQWAANHGTSQIYSSGVEMALCSDDNKQIGTFVLCKDFFQDAILAYIHKIKCSIYGYTYDESMPPIPQNNLKVLIAKSNDKDFPKKAEAIPDLLHQIEEKLNISKTTIENCESPPDKYKCGVFLLTADKIWMHAPPLLSLWTLLARNGTQHKIGDKWEVTIDNIIAGKVTPAQSNDHIYLKYGKPGLELILEKGIPSLFGNSQVDNYPKNKGGSAMHHYSGIVSYGSCKAKVHFPNWVYPAQESSPPSICFA